MGGVRTGGLARSADVTGRPFYGRPQRREAPLLVEDGGDAMPDPPEATHVEFRLLGPMTIAAADRTVSLPGAAERALLALLLLSPGRIVTANALIDRLWDEDDLPADPANAL